MNELKVFDNTDLGLKVRTILNDDGSISVNAEDTAIGFGWVQTQNKNGKQYTSVRWETINGWCESFGFPNKLGKEDYIPESLFYRLGMKANNATADKFQNWLAIDVIPSIRKSGVYSNRSPKIEQSAFMVKFVADDLRVNEASRLLMYENMCKDFNIPTGFLPKYEHNGNRQLKSLTALLNENQCGMSAVKFNAILVKNGYFEERERKSSAGGGTKKFKALTENGLQYGENAVSPHNQREVQPLYYSDTFMELFFNIR